MAVDERSRHELYLWLEQAAGPERAATLMSLLPPVGWADVATKQDLEHLRAHTDQRFESIHAYMDQRFDLTENRLLATIRAELANVRGDMASVRGEMVQQVRTLLFAVVTMMVTLVSLTYAAVRLG